MIFPSRTLLRLGAVVVLAVAALALPRPAQACTCIPAPTPLVALDSSDAVFSGTVEHIAKVRGSHGYPVHLVTIRVIESWKGVSESRVVVQTATNSAACGYHFRKGEDYLVYANSWQDQPLSTGICTRTAELSRATEDLEALDDGAVWKSDAVIRPCGGPTAGAILQTLAFSLVAVAFGRRRWEAPRSRCG